MIGRRVPDHLRAAFVAFHLMAITLAALPAPGPAALRPGAFDHPTVVAETRAWSARLGALGIEVDPEVLRARVESAATTFERGRERVLAPFEPYYAVVGTRQSWRMFAAPRRTSARLFVEVDERGNGRWRTMYESLSPTATWHREWFVHDRMRGSVLTYSWDGKVSGRRAFVDWLARAVSAELPEAERMRVGFLRAEALTAEELRAGATREERRVLVETRVLRSATRR